MMYNPKEISFDEHDLLVMLPNERIHYKALEPWSISWVGLYGETIKEYMDLLGVTPQNPILHISLYNELKTILDETLREGAETLPYAKSDETLREEQAPPLRKIFKLWVCICEWWRFILREKLLP